MPLWPHQGDTSRSHIIRSCGPRIHKLLPGLSPGHPHPREPATSRQHRVAGWLHDRTEETQSLRSGAQPLVTLKGRYSAWVKVKDWHPMRQNDPRLGMNQTHSGKQKLQGGTAQPCNSSSEPLWEEVPRGPGLWEKGRLVPEEDLGEAGGPGTSS